MRPVASVVLFADKLYSRRAIHNVDAFGLEFLFKARHQDDVADASRIAVRVVKRHILVVEEVRNREFGVGRAFVIAFPERHLNVVLCGKINGQSMQAPHFLANIQSRRSSMRPWPQAIRRRTISAASTLTFMDFCTLLPKAVM